jgi:hypothetical protein
MRRVGLVDFEGLMMTMKDLLCLAGMPMIIFPAIYFLFYLFSQGHFAY